MTLFCIYLIFLIPLFFLYQPYPCVNRELQHLKLGLKTAAFPSITLCVDCLVGGEKARPSWGFAVCQES